MGDPSHQRRRSAIQEFERAHHIMSRDDEWNNALVKNVTLDWFYNPHTLSALAVVLLGVISLAFFGGVGDNDDAQLDWQNLRIGVAVAAACFLVLGLLHFPAGPFTRPHPVLWRLTFGVGVLYLFCLVVLLFQSQAGARRMMLFFSDSLNKPLKAKSYAADCSFTWEAIRPNLDRFVVAHFLGWVGKALMVRNRLICWTVSITWELIEMGLIYALPNFEECWWDQWLLDVLLANGIGIEVGHRLCDWLEMREYRWSGIFQIPTMAGKAKRLALQFTPASWTRVRWEPFDSIRRLLVANFLILMLQAIELHAFVLKVVLWVPIEHVINPIRLAMWMFLACAAVRQLYVYVADPRCKRLGSHAVLCIAIAVVEFCVCLKHSRGVFPPMPAENRFWWQFGLATWVLTIVGLCVNISRRQTGDTEPTDADPKRKQN